MDDDIIELACHVCGHVGLEDGSDGFFYCQNCWSQANDIRDMGHEFVDFGTPSAYMSTRRRRCRTSTPAAAEQPMSKVDHVGPTGPMDFGSVDRQLTYSDYHSQIRMRYSIGIQVLIKLQCTALVEVFHVNDRVVDEAESIWTRFLPLSGILADDWADEAITQSESQTQGPVDGFAPSGNHRDEPHNLHGQRAVMIWYRSLSKTIPLSHSLVISFLACHVLREAVLPTDILKWIIEGKLPYFAAFADIEKKIDPPPKGCPISSSRMFRPTHALSLQKLESTAAIIAETVGLKLPPVNFSAIASRYLQRMSLSVDKILPHACLIYEWSTPPECQLSANSLRLPTRACVMSILIVSIRILYSLHGSGYWEANFSGSTCLSSTACWKTELDSKSDVDLKDVADHQLNIDAKELLLTLYTNYGNLLDTYDYLKDMPTYLQYVKDLVFSGIGPSYEDIEENKIIEEYWSLYQRQVVLSSSHDHEEMSLGHNSGDNKTPREDDRGTPMSSKKFRKDEFTKSQSNRKKDNSSNEGSNSFSRKHSRDESDREKEVNRLKSNMVANRFWYVPPRDNCNKKDYIQYSRKKNEGAYAYAAHADYYILLRACARVAQMDIRCLHAGVLSFERRLASLEKNIDRGQHVKLPTDTCGRDDEVEVNANDVVDINATDGVEVNTVMGFSD